MKRRFVFFLFVMVVESALFSQVDSTILLQGIDVIEGRNTQTILSTTPVQIIDTKSIERLPAVQLSDVLKIFSGVVIKDYGGVGGMKTVSVRGFGAQHTAIAYDGIAVTDCQTGQVDLSKFTLHNVNQISMNNGFDDDIFVPARLFASAALVNITTLTPQFLDTKPVNIDFHFTGGSFGYINPVLRIENRIVKRKNSSLPLLSSSLNINYVQSKGDYPFTIYYGGVNDSTSRERRANSDVKNFSAEGNLFFTFNSRSKLNLKLCYYQSERGLPGAVIFYKIHHSKERLKDQNVFAQLHYENRFNAQFAYQTNLKFNYSYQQYLDPEYLNSAGFLDNRYFQRELYFSNTFLYAPHRVVSLSVSNDLIYNNMSMNSEDFSMPKRYSSLTVLSCLVDTRHVDVRAGLLHTFVVNRVKIGEPAGDVNRLSPALGISVKPLLKENFVIRLFYKNIFRLPSFNDLYYRMVGNIDLKPENTHQTNLGLAYERLFFKKKMGVSVGADGYYNWVKDKIVAIPNKNLFVWTMLNFGEVEIAGVDVHATFDYKICKFLSINLLGNYSFQYAVDKTDKKSKTYGHQIPYTPLHSGSASFSLLTPYVDVTYTALFCGERYAFRQNTKENLMPMYVDHSLTVAKDFTIRRVVVLGAKIELLNLANKHYEIIRNYPMQGRSFRVGIHLKW